MPHSKLHHLLVLQLGQFGPLFDMPPGSARHGLSAAIADPLASLRWLLLDPAAFVWMSALLLVGELVLNLGIIQFVPCAFDSFAGPWQDVYLLRSFFALS